jgi:hypothetical protein
MSKVTCINDECVIAAVLATKAAVKSRALSQMLDRFTPSQIARHHIEHPPTLHECERMAERLEPMSALAIIQPCCSAIRRGAPCCSGVAT